MRWQKLWLLLPSRRRTYRAAVAELHRWQEDERERMAAYNLRVRRIVTDDGGRSWR